MGNHDSIEKEFFYTAGFNKGKILVFETIVVENSPLLSQVGYALFLFNGL